MAGYRCPCDQCMNRSGLATQGSEYVDVSGEPLDAQLLLDFVSDPAAGAAAAFTRTLNGEVLAFDSVDDMTMRDRETGSLWSAVRGEALSGPLAGAQLEQLPAFVSFWFAWSDFYPGTEVWEPETTPAT